MEIFATILQTFTRFWTLFFFIKGEISFQHPKKTVFIRTMFSCQICLEYLFWGSLFLLTKPLVLVDFSFFFYKWSGVPLVDFHNSDLESPSQFSAVDNCWGVAEWRLEYRSLINFSSIWKKINPMLSFFCNKGKGLSLFLIYIQLKIVIIPIVLYY